MAIEEVGRGDARDPISHDGDIDARRIMPVRVGRERLAAFHQQGCSRRDRIIGH
jgi:hypothetical protein